MNEEEEDDEFGDLLDEGVQLEVEKESIGRMNDESIQLEYKKYKRLSDVIKNKTHEQLNHLIGETSINEGEEEVTAGSLDIVHAEIFENPDVKVNPEPKQKQLKTFKLGLIKHLTKAYLENIYRGDSKVSLSEDDQVTKRLYNECRDGNVENFQETLVEKIGEILESEDLCEINSEGERIPLSPQRRAEIREAFAKEVYQAVSAYILANPTKLESNHTDHTNLYIAQDQVESKREIIAPVLNHQEYHQERIELLYKATIISLDILHITEFRIAKHHQEMLKEDMDLSNRIIEMEIKRANIKRDGVMRDIEHFGVKIGSKNKQDEKIDSLTSSIIRSDSKNSDQSTNIVWKSKKNLIGLKNQM